VRRGVPAAIITVVGLGALASFKSAAPVVAKSAARPRTRATTPAATAPPRPRAASGPPSAPTPTPKTPPTTASTTRTATGDVIENRYGPVQVRVTLRGSQIVSVDAVQLPSDRALSAEISDQAGPLLQQEALQAQSAQIDIVSGATYTSDSYAQSLQSALDKMQP
jgi:uncharacterized protein with FMN-binding domain